MSIYMLFFYIKSILQIFLHDHSNFVIKIKYVLYRILQYSFNNCMSFRSTELFSEINDIGIAEFKKSMMLYIRMKKCPQFEILVI
jgi:hypothetical protein